MELPDELIIDINGPTAYDASVWFTDGRVVAGVIAVTITYRMGEFGTVDVEAVDLDGDIVDGELPLLRRSYAVNTNTPATVLLPAIAFAEQPVK